MKGGEDKLDKKIRILILGTVLLLAIVSIAYTVVGGGDIIYRIKYVGDVTFSHDSHVTERGFKCDDCHPAIFPLPRDKEKKRTMAEIRAKKACGVCHNGKNAFDVEGNCYVCHKR